MARVLVGIDLQSRHRLSGPRAQDRRRHLSLRRHHQPRRSAVRRTVARMARIAYCPRPRPETDGLRSHGTPPRPLDHPRPGRPRRRPSLRRPAPCRHALQLSARELRVPCGPNRRRRTELRRLGPLPRGPVHHSDRYPAPDPQHTRRARRGPHVHASAQRRLCGGRLLHPRRKRKPPHQPAGLA